MISNKIFCDLEFVLCDIFGGNYVNIPSMPALLIQIRCEWTLVRWVWSEFMDVMSWSLNLNKYQVCSCRTETENYSDVMWKLNKAEGWNDEMLGSTTWTTLDHVTCNCVPDPGWILISAGTLAGGRLSPFVVLSFESPQIDSCVLIKWVRVIKSYNSSK